MSEQPSCIDISHWQGFPDFTEVRKAGVVAMIHKATEGTSYIDPNRATNINRAMQAGIACCTYHWLSPGNAAEQMAHYIKTIDPVPGARMVIDYEEDGCTLSDLKEAVQALLDDPRGLQVTVYSGHLLKEQLGDKYDGYLAETTDLWLAQYTTRDPSWPDGTYPTYTLWQYSETGKINGIDDAHVDLNRFNGSDRELVDWINPARRAPQPQSDQVSIDITVPDNVELKISINGNPLVIGDR